MSSNLLKGLFINCAEAQDSIFESGRMVYNCLQDSQSFSLAYTEITIDRVGISGGYDFYLFNYHPLTMSWLDTRLIRDSVSGVVMTVVLEVSPGDPFVLCPPNDFDAYIVLDPTLDVGLENVFAFPRPLERYDGKLVYEPTSVPVIGSFGFATKGKGFEHVVEVVNQEFETAKVRINIPYATYADESHSYAQELARNCISAAEPGIDVIVTHDYMSKSELIEWCGRNTINCFFYDRNMPGLAATTDQAITSGRPLLISKNDTFRHIEQYIRPYPEQSIRQAIETTAEQVKAIQHAWSPLKFRERFESVLTNFEFDKGQEHRSEIVLKLKPGAVPSRLQLVRDKLAIRTRLGRLFSGRGPH